jgi:hypothetical protein
MPTHYSDQVGQLPAYCTTPPPDRVAPGDQGKERVYRFSYTVPVGNETVANIVYMVQIESLCRMCGGNWWNTALTTAGAAAGISWGILPAVTRAGSHTATAMVKGTSIPAYFLAETSVDGIISGTGFGVTFLLGFDELLYPGDIITATALTEAWAAAGYIVGGVRVAEP